MLFLRKTAESRYKNQAGFTLIGVVVASAMGLIVITGLTQMFANMASKVNEMENRGKKVFFNEFVGGVLRDGCENTLKATPDGATDPISKTISQGNKVDFYRLKNENDHTVLDLSAEADRLEAQYGIVESPHFQLICPEQDHDNDPTTPPEANCDCRGTATTPCSRKWVLSLITQRRVHGLPVFDIGIAFELDIVWNNEVKLAVTHTGGPPYPAHFHGDFSCNVVGILTGVGGNDECQYSDEDNLLALVGCGTTTSIREKTTTAYGYNAGKAGVGEQNTLIGYEAGKSTTGINNVFVGFQAGKSNTTGASNVFVGWRAGSSNTASYNTFVGDWAGHKNTIGSRNVFMGNEAGQHNSTGYQNTYVGYAAGRSNTKGFTNTFVGESAGRSNIDGYNNVFVGNSAGRSNTTGEYNTFLGGFTGRYNTEGIRNTFVGVSAGQDNSTGSRNTFVGISAGLSNTTGNSNTFLGHRAGESNTTGSNSIIIRAGTTERKSGTVWSFLKPKKPRSIAKAEPGSHNILIGSFSNKEEKQMMKKGDYMWIAGLIEGDSRKKWVAIHNELKTNNLYASLNSPSDKRLKKDIQILDSDWAFSLISKIQPYSFEWKDAGKGSGTQWGFMAQELKPIAPALVKTDHEGFFYVNYPKLIPLLVSAFQKFQKSVTDQLRKLEDFKKNILSKLQALEDFKKNMSTKNLKLEKEIASLKAELAEYKTRLEELEGQNKKK